MAQLRPLEQVRAAFQEHCHTDPDDGNEFLRYPDAHTALCSLGLTPLTHEVKEACAALDVAQEGSISWDAFKELYVAFHRKAVDALATVKRFVMIDEKKTGFISQSDIEAFLATDPDINAPKVAAELWKGVTASAVERGDADLEKVSAMEFAMALTPDADADEVIAHIKTYYHCDADAPALRWQTKPKHGTSHRRKSAAAVADRPPTPQATPQREPTPQAREQTPQASPVKAEEPKPAPKPEPKPEPKPAVKEEKGGCCIVM